MHLVPVHAAVSFGWSVPCRRAKSLLGAKFGASTELERLIAGTLNDPNLVATVFAPTNDAFTKLLQQMKMSKVRTTPCSCH